MRSRPAPSRCGVANGSLRPASIATPTTTSATPITAVAYLALRLSHVVTKLLRIPATTNTPMKPLETAADTTQGPAHRRSLRAATLGLDAEEVDEVRRQQHEGARVDGSDHPAEERELDVHPTAQ